MSADQSWRLRANCRGLDPNLFWPERGEDPAPAMAVCAGCQVAGPCLEYALSLGKDDGGIWAGTTHRQRRPMRRERRERLRAARAQATGGAA